MRKVVILVRKERLSRAKYERTANVRHVRNTVKVRQGNQRS